MAIEGTSYEIELVRTAKEILLRFIDVNPNHYMSDMGVLNSEKIEAAIKVIVGALHKAVKGG